VTTLFCVAATLRCRNAYQGSALPTELHQLKTLFISQSVEVTPMTTLFCVAATLAAATLTKGVLYQLSYISSKQNWRQSPTAQTCFRYQQLTGKSFWR
jgi:hypothetical protein